MDSCKEARQTYRYVISYTGFVIRLEQLIKPVGTMQWSGDEV